MKNDLLVRLVVLGLATAGCGGGAGEPLPTGVARAAIVGGSLVDTPDSPVLYLRGQEGDCSAILIASNLIATARHCIARSTPGSFSCTASGELILSGNGAGQIGNDFPPDSVGVYTAESIAAHRLAANDPDAKGLRILSTRTPTSCRDDLAFVVLDQVMPNIVPVPVRIDEVTQVGETISVWGYGLTDQVDQLALRTRSDAQIVGVGPDTPSNDTQPAPVRAVRTGPVTCQGDSGGPMLSSDGALVAIVSLGNQAGSSGPFCSDNGYAGTVGPRLAAYHDLVVSALAAAAESNMVDGGIADTGTVIEEAPDPDDSAVPEDALDSGAPAVPTFEGRGSGCAVSARRFHARPLGMAAMAFALAAAAALRRRG